MVLYNLYLIRQLKVHINVEICSSVQVIKYIYIYIYKGLDHITIQIEIGKDEIAQYLYRRYIGQIEVIWQIFEFSIYKKFSLVEKLVIYLLGKQPVYYEEDVVVEEFQERMDSAQSTFMAFFKYNNTNKKSRRYFYQEFPKHYIFLRKKQ